MQDADACGREAARACGWPADNGGRRLLLVRSTPQLPLPCVTLLPANQSRHGFTSRLAPPAPADTAQARFSRPERTVPGATPTLAHK